MGEPLERAPDNGWWQMQVVVFCHQPLECVPNTRHWPITSVHQTPIIGPFIWRFSGSRLSSKDRLADRTPGTSQRGYEWGIKCQRLKKYPRPVTTSAVGCGHPQSSRNVAIISPSLRQPSASRPFLSTILSSFSDGPFDCFFLPCSHFCTVQGPVFKYAANNRLAGLKAPPQFLDLAGTVVFDRRQAQRIKLTHRGHIHGARFLQTFRRLRPVKSIQTGLPCQPSLPRSILSPPGALAEGCRAYSAIIPERGD
jgi:hypothetical protein